MGIFIISLCASTVQLHISTENLNVCTQPVVYK